MTAIKHDGDKPKMSLLSSVALEGLAKVMTYGASKYDSHNWRKGFNWTRLIDSLQRHMLAFNDGVDIDKESGLPHIDHVAANVMMLQEHYHKALGIDDRYKLQAKSMEGIVEAINTPTDIKVANTLIMNCCTILDISVQELAHLINLSKDSLCGYMTDPEDFPYTDSRLRLLRYIMKKLQGFGICNKDIYELLYWNNFYDDDKMLIQYVQNDTEISYEDLINKIQQTVQSYEDRPTSQKREGISNYPLWQEAATKLDTSIGVLTGMYGSNVLTADSDYDYRTVKSLLTLIDICLDKDLSGEQILNILKEPCYSQRQYETIFGRLQYNSKIDQELLDILDKFIKEYIDMNNDII